MGRRDSTLVAWMAVATQVLVVAAILLAVFASIALRRRPLAVLRALGASRGYLFLVVWVHVSLLVTAGAAAGLVLGWAGAGVLSSLVAARTSLALSVTPGWPEVRMVLALIGAGLGLAALPSAWSYRHPVATALRAS